MSDLLRILGELVGWLFGPEMAGYTITAMVFFCLGVAVGRWICGKGRR